MQTNRRTFIFKRGKVFEAIELIKAGPYPPIRVYGPDTIAAGPFDALTAEWENEMLTDLSK